MPKRKSQKTQSNKHKQQKVKQDDNNELVINLPTLPRDLWGCVLVNLTFFELRKCCFRVCKQFKELTFKVAKDLDLRQKALKTKWRELLNDFGKLSSCLSKLASNTTAQHISIQTLHLPVDHTLKNSDLSIFPSWILSSLTRLDISNVRYNENFPETFIKHCPNLTGLNIYRCFPEPNAKQIAPNLKSLRLHFFSSFGTSDCTLDDCLPSTLQNLYIDVSISEMKKATLPPVKLLHWSNDSYTSTQEILNLPDSIEYGAINALGKTEANTMVASFPCSLLSLKFRFHFSISILIFKNDQLVKREYGQEYILLIH